MTTALIFCPVDDCAWGRGLIYNPHALLHAHRMRMEDRLDDHLHTHSVAEFVSTIARLRAALETP